MLHSRFLVRHSSLATRFLSSVTTTSTVQKPQKIIVQDEFFRSSINSRMEELRTTASFYGSNQPLLKLPTLPRAAPIIDPTPQIIKKGDPECDREILEDPLSANKAEIKDPEKRIKKWAHRMLRIRKRKMKVHQRKKRWRKNKVFYQTRIFNRIKSREIAFRTALLDKIQSAEAFDPESYVKEYLEDFNTPLIPLTYQGRRLPVWLIKELLVQDELKKKRELDLQLNMLSKAPLVREGETVQDFVKRIQPELDLYKV